MEDGFALENGSEGVWSERVGCLGMWSRFVMVERIEAMCGRDSETSG